jgi:hypothetical protein
MSLKPVSSQRDYGFHRAGFREEVGGAGRDLHCFLTSQSGVSAFVELDHSGISPAKRREPNTVPLCLRKKAIFNFKSETSPDLRAFSDDQGGHGCLHSSDPGTQLVSSARRRCLRTI